MHPEQAAAPEKKNFYQTCIAWAIIFCAVTAPFFYWVLFSPPESFPSESLVSIRKGDTVNDIANQFKEKHVVRSAFYFKLLAHLLGGSTGVIAGKYYFNEPLSAFAVVSRVVTGAYNVKLQKIIIPEGFTAKDIAARLMQTFPDFDGNLFLQIAKEKEGYLFPDTYRWLPDVEPIQVVMDMQQNFHKKTAPFSQAIAVFGKPLKDVIIMAALIEKDARQIEKEKIVAGILWKRLSIGMSLQVDAVFPYINGKNTLQLSLEDLKVDHPYNTYTRKGLPPGPISNPGLDAILSTITPTDSPYLYYLSDKGGNMHYARTFDGHLENKEKYLR